jgi:hypothetical protein
MKSLKRLGFLQFLLALFVMSAAISALADPPSRAVRLKYMSGAVSVQPGGVNDWVEAVINRPLTTADRVWTDQNARAELGLGSASVRMNAETSMTLTNVSDEIVQVELDQGTMSLHIRHLFGGETYEIDTPNQAFTILKPGDYRFDVDPNADTTSVTVWKGEGEANGQGSGVRVRSGEQASFTGGTSLEHRTSRAPGLDGFDDWCRVRDNREDHSESYRYVSSDVIGADDLDDYGTWRTTGEYGAVWVPRVAPDWAPYRYGHWVWVEPWGWSWVDDAPWGFAPCHYGRWIHTGGYWGWAPGPMVVERPIYAPALVAWVGGEHVGVSVSFGGGDRVGWFPLGWGEPYVPSYHVSRAYFQNVNVRNTRIVNITNVTNNYYVENNTTVVNRNVTNIRYANQNVNGAVTAVPTRVMVNSQAVARNAVVVPANQLRNVSVSAAPAVAPDRSSVLGAGQGRNTAPPARVANARPVFAKTAPPPKPVPFEAKQQVLEKTPGRPLDNRTEAELRARVEREAPPAPNRNAPAPGGRPGAAPATAPTPNPNAPRDNAAPRPGGPDRPGNQPSRNEAPAPAGRPGAAPATNPNAPQPNAAPRPTGPQRPAMNQPGNPEAPGRNVPRPPQPGAPANAAPPANEPRAVPRPPSPDNSRQPERAPNTDRERPNSANDPNERGAQPARPQPEPPRANQPARPENAPAPNVPLPPRETAPRDNGRPNTPQPPRNAAPSNAEQPGRSDRESAPARNAPQPPRQDTPRGNDRPNTQQAPRNVPPPSAEQPSRNSPPPRAEQPRPAPAPRPEAQPRPEPQRAPAESRPQRQEAPPRDARPQHEEKPQNQSRNEKPNPSRRQDKPDKNNFR